MPSLVSRHAVTGTAASTVEKVLQLIAKASPGWLRHEDPELPSVAWNKPYRGHCTCGFDRVMRVWLLENPHSYSCGYPDDGCDCGQWQELTRWKDGLGHRPECGKAIPTLTVNGLGLFLETDGRWQTDREMTTAEWKQWKQGVPLSLALSRAA